MACGSCGGQPRRPTAAGASAKCLTCASRFYPTADDPEAGTRLGGEHAQLTGHAVVPTRNRARTTGIAPPPEADPFRIRRGTEQTLTP